MPAGLAYPALTAAGQLYGGGAPMQFGNAAAAPATTTPMPNQAPLVMSRYGQWVPANHPDAMNNPLAALPPGPAPAPVAAPGSPPTAARNPWAYASPGPGTLGNLYSQSVGPLASNAIQRPQVMPQRFGLPPGQLPGPNTGSYMGQPQLYTPPTTMAQPQLGAGQLGSLVRRMY